MNKNGKLSIESTNPDWCGEWLQQEVEADAAELLEGVHWLDYLFERIFADLPLGYSMDHIARTLKPCTNASLHMKLNSDEVHINYENFPYAS